MIKQRTLKNVIRASGVGLHSGDKAYLTLRPAPVNTGIVFCRVDLGIEIPARAEYVSDTRMATTLHWNGASVATVEHLLSALAGMGIDNAYIDVTAPEVPIMDGSAAPFVLLIQCAGIVEQNAPKVFIRIKERITVEDGNKERAADGSYHSSYKYATFEPYDGYKIDFTIDFDHPLFHERAQHISIDMSTTSFMKEISRARTFGFLSDYERLREMNLALGGSLNNAVVLDKYRILNEEGLRYADEFVRHKVLDALGDLSLLGNVIIGAFHGYKSGHGLNNQLIKALLANEKAWEYVTFEDEETDFSTLSFGRPVLVYA